jgi:poly-gamma-glutamate capsule biosynthesis protein CapA/YwtB (metallophosphatase superfamily)
LARLVLGAKDAMGSERASTIGLFLGGDVMTGRGVDQAMAHPVDPVLYEQCVRDARWYVTLAERANGPIPRPVDGGYLWGDALAEIDRAGVDVRIVNLETSITTSADAWPAKGIHYRMHPANVGCLAAAGLDCCCLANNHVLDWGHAGLAETLRVLDGAGVAHPGAGADLAEAAAPAALDVPRKGRVLVFAMAAESSGVPPEWAAGAGVPGVNLLPDLSAGTADRVAYRIGFAKSPGDVAVASIHWGGNWGYEVPEEHVAFAHRLVDGGVDVVHGHSSHHPKAVEVYRGRLVLYGCGDLLDDYEGIGGYEQFRPDLRLLYFVLVDPNGGRLVEARLVPVRPRRFRLELAPPEDAAWLRGLLTGQGLPFGTRAEPADEGGLVLRWR